MEFNCQFWGEIKKKLKSMLQIFSTILIKEHKSQELDALEKWHLSSHCVSEEIIDSNIYCNKWDTCTNLLSDVTLIWVASQVPKSHRGWLLSMIMNSEILPHMYVLDRDLHTADLWFFDVCGIEEMVSVSRSIQGIKDIIENPHHSSCHSVSMFLQHLKLCIHVK